MARHDALSSLRCESFKRAISQIAEYNPRALIRIVRKLSFYLGIDTPGNYKDVRKTIIVQVDDSGAPTNKPRFRTNSGFPRYIIKTSVSVIVIDARCVICKMRLKQVQVSVEIVVSDSHSHSRLLHPVVTQADTP